MKAERAAEDVGVYGISMLYAKHRKGHICGVTSSVAEISSSIVRIA